MALKHTKKERNTEEIRCHVLFDGTFSNHISQMHPHTCGANQFERWWKIGYEWKKNDQERENVEKVFQLYQMNWIHRICSVLVVRATKRKLDNWILSWSPWWERMKDYNCQDKRNLSGKNDVVASFFTLWISGSFYIDILFSFAQFWSNYNFVCDDWIYDGN